jgi:hypothetical protein
MPYIPVVGDYLLVRHACAMTNQVSFNNIVYQVRSVAGGGVTDQAIVTTVDGLVAPLMKVILGNNASWYGTSLGKIWPLPRTATVIETGNAGVGTAVTPSQPGQVAGIIKGKTDLAGHKQRARLYLPFVYEGGNDTITNVPTAAAIAHFNTIAAQVYTPYTVTVGMNSTTVVPVVFHRLTHTSNDITAYGPGLKWATQKRRGNYGQPNVFPPF